MLPDLIPSRVPHPSSLPLNILAAEDDHFSAQLLEQLLVRRGHRVRLANNGRTALAMAEEGAFDLLLLDVHMPEMDGFQVIQKIRERERFVGGHLPVIALTARSRKEDRERCLAAGMDDFLAKPIQAPDLWTAIDRVMSREEEGRRKEEKENGSASDSSLVSKDEVRRMEDKNEPPLASDSAFIPHPSSLLNARVLLAACGGDAVILEKICQAFGAGLPEHLAEVQNALREQNAVRLCKAAHKLCGMVAAFSSEAGEVTSKIEDIAAQGQLDEARPLVAQLETMATELVRLTRALSLDSLRE